MRQTIKNKDGAFPSVLSAALLQTAAQTPWVPVLAAGITAALLRGLPKTQSPKWLRYAQGLWSIPVLAQVLHWTGSCWETPAAKLWVPGVLLVLALWMWGKGTAAGNDGTSVLGLLQLGLIAIILAAGIGEIQKENLCPVWQWPSGWLLAMLLLPGEKKGSGSGWLWAVAFSVVTMGVLNGKGGFYEMSKSISLFGSVKRLESLAAVAMTVGFVALLRQILECFDTSAFAVVGAMLAYALFYADLRVPGAAAAGISVLLWSALPACIGKRDGKEKKEVY